MLSFELLLMLKFYFYRTNLLTFSMKKLTLSAFALLLFSINTIAQDSSTIYATMDVENAEMYKSIYPDEIQILDSNDKRSAVLMTERSEERRVGKEGIS